MQASWVRMGALGILGILLTVAAISSIEAEVSSRLAACSSVRCDRSVVLVEISADAFDTSRVDSTIAVRVFLQLVDRAVEVLMHSGIPRPSCRAHDR